jgi:BMFP domain-containing protein YqiC
VTKPTIESLAGRLSEVVPERIKALGSRLPGGPGEIPRVDEALQGLGIAELKQDLEQNFHAVLQGAFERMELVSREEFDVQRKVLARTREKLEQLEAELARMQAGSAGAGQQGSTDAEPKDVS